jgi:hypothetical protein
MKYPEIYNIEDIEVWKQTYMRKEILTNEWDLICHEVSTDVFEIPTLTNEFCDKFVEDNKEVEGESIMLWGNSCDDVKYPSNFDEIMVGIIRDNVINALHHLWTIDVPSFQKMTLDNRLITCYMKMDSDSTGGELFFPKYDFTLKPKQGHLYFFPGRLTHRYGINLIKSGVNNSLFIYFMDK